jgi:hypothetical protein
MAPNPQVSPIGAPEMRVAKPAIAPTIGGEMASPRRRITTMFRANAVARIERCVTFVKIVLVGP